jgi:hypothetical protein
MAAVRHSGQTRPLREAGIALILLSLLLPQRAVCAGLPAGMIVWWGREIVFRGTYSEHTNGLIEIGNEVLSNVVAIAGGPSQGLALKSDSTVTAFGLGMLGWNEVPPGLSNVTSIAVEGNSCWAIKQDSTVARWGEGDKDEANIVAGLSNVTAIAWAGYRSYLALKKEGTVSGFRLHDSGLTNGPAAQPSVLPVSVHGESLSEVVALGSGYEPPVLKMDGTVLHLRYWKPGTPRPEPEVTKVEADGFTLDLGGEFSKTPYDYTSADLVQVRGQILSNVTAIAGGGRYVLALKKDGTLVAWSGIDNSQAAVPEGLSNVTAIAVAEPLCMALRRDGTVLSWGVNDISHSSVPAGLSNVVAIAAGGDVHFALTTGNIPASVFTYPHGRLEEMEREADLIFKGRVISTRAATNASFPSWGKPHATRFSLISILDGHVQTNELVFWHNTGEPGAWGGGRPPSSHQFEPGNSYLVFAGRLDKPDYLYSVPPDATNRPNEFRQLCYDGVIRTLDARPVGARDVKDAHWVELRLLLQDTNATNQLYAIDTLDRASLAGRSDDRWRHTDDFKRNAVLSAVLPLVTNKNEQVASRALSCFTTESNATTMLQPFATVLIKVAAEGPSSGLRLTAIGALSGTQFGSISNSLVQLLRDASGSVRSKAVALLALCPADFAERELCRCAEDDSLKVRAGVADVIGGGTMPKLLPTLTKLFVDPVGRHQPVAPLTIEELEGGGRIVGVESGVTTVDDPNYPGANVGDVHTSAGYALLKFDVEQVGEILRTNLNDAGFRLQFLLKLAEADPNPWINDMVEIMEARRARNVRKAEASHAPPGTFMYLSGAYWRCWRTLYAYLEKLPATEFANGKQDRNLQVLEQAGNTGSQEPVMLYELYKAKGLSRRAAQYRSENGGYSGYNLGESFNRVDAKYSTNVVNPQK